jgi:trans-aconitate 2-methyltransferase
MFAPDFLAAAPDHHRAALICDVERRLRPALHRDGGWLADYRRLRLVAIKDPWRAGEH